MPTRTSITHPIRVDWLTTATPGRVGLTFAPGKHGRSTYENGQWERDLAMDLDRLVSAFSVKTLVCLLEDHELVQLEIPTLVDDARARGLVVHRLPIQDAGVPHDMEQVRTTVDLIRASAARGDNAIAHCMGGLGRAGTIGGCVLVASGMSPAEALADVARARGPNAPETDGQKAFVRRFAEFMATRTGG